MKKILGLLLATSSIFSMQLDRVHKFQEKLLHNELNVSGLNKVYIKPTSVFVPHKLGEVKLFHGKNGFVIHKDDKKYTIQKCFTDPALRNITRKQLKAFQEVGYFAINQMDDGEFSLKAKVRGPGGGPIFGAFMYWLTKSACYSVVATAVGGIAISTGGAAVGAITGGAAHIAGAAVVGTATTTTLTGGVIASTAGAAAVSTGASAIVTTAGVVTAGTGAAAVVGGTVGLAGAVATGASAAGATIGGIALTEAAALATVGTVSSVAAAGSTGSFLAAMTTCVVAVESVSIAVGTFCGMAPTI